MVRREATVEQNAVHPKGVSGLTGSNCADSRLDMRLDICRREFELLRIRLLLVVVVVVVVVGEVVIHFSFILPLYLPLL